MNNNIKIYHTALISMSLKYAGLVFLFLLTSVLYGQKPKILFFYESSINIPVLRDGGWAKIEALLKENDYDVTSTKDASEFQIDNLNNYDAVMFFNTCKDYGFSQDNKNAFEQYIKEGGNFIGVHCAAWNKHNGNMAEPWAFYHEVLGASASGHSQVVNGKVSVVDDTHPSTSDLPATWEIIDEWYYWDRTDLTPLWENDPNPINLLIEVVETTTSKPLPIPVSWYQELEWGGRSFYNGMGHTNDVMDNPNYQKHLLGGVEWAVGNTSTKILLQSGKKDLTISNDKTPVSRYDIRGRHLTRELLDRPTVPWKIIEK